MLCLAPWQGVISWKHSGRALLVFTPLHHMGKAQTKAKAQAAAARQGGMDKIFPKGICAGMEERGLTFSALLCVSQIVIEKRGNGFKLK